MSTEQRCCENTDRELWREREGDYYADSIHVTKEGGIGINCGGYVYVKPLREWHALAMAEWCRYCDDNGKVDGETCRVCNGTRRMPKVSL